MGIGAVEVMTISRLPDCDLEWAADGTPRSSRFGDIYYAPDNGLAESRYVFLDGIGAPGVWQDRDHFTIAETGFGTGLNFLAVWELWRKTAVPDASLYYVAVEAYPMARADLVRALAAWSELAPLAAELAAVYPHRLGGFHALDLDQGRVRLILLFGDAAAMLGRLTACVDAWLLDGFAPACNPGMWSPALFQTVAALSRRNTCLATFTVAGVVRRGLADRGFVIEKRPGYGKKRECLKAVYQGQPSHSDPAPWYAPPRPCKRPQSVAIIGAGISGLMTAWTLKRAGYAPVVYDQADRLLAEASGNPVAVLEPWIDLGVTAAARFAQAATLYALSWYGRHGGDAFAATGVLLRDDPLRLAAIRDTGILPAEDLEQSDHGLLYKTAGMINTARLAAILATDVDIRLNSALVDLPDADVVIVAASFASEQLAGFPLSLVARRGQVTVIPGDPGIDTVISGGGYVTPAFATAGDAHPVDRRFLVGASFAPADPTTDAWRAMSETDRAENFRILSELVPQASSIKPSAAIDRVGLRATTADHLPIMGGIPDGTYAAAYAGLSQGRRGPYPIVPYRSGVYVLTALGARGYLTAPLLAHSLVALIEGTPNPLERPILDALHPGRDVIRTIKRVLQKKKG